MREIFSGFRAGTITALMAGVATALGQRAMGDVQMALAQHTGDSRRRNRLHPHRTRVNNPSKGPRLGRAPGPGSYAEMSPQQITNAEREALRVARTMDFADAELRTLAFMRQESLL